jgi:acetoin utilization protein AcuB
MTRPKKAEAVHQFPQVREYMTPAPLTTTPTRSLTSAVKAMRGKRVRHLPVLDGDRVVGILSQRDVLIMESLPGVNPTEVRVEEAMVRDVFTVGPETPIAEALETMIARKIGSAIVTAGKDVVGVFTTIDALRALHRLLRRA